MGHDGAYRSLPYPSQFDRFLTDASGVLSELNEADRPLNSPACCVVGLLHCFPGGPKRSLCHFDLMYLVGYLPQFLCGFVVSI